MCFTISFLLLQFECATSRACLLFGVAPTSSSGPQKARNYSVQRATRSRRAKSEQKYHIFLCRLRWIVYDSMSKALWSPFMFCSRIEDNGQTIETMIHAMNIKCTLLHWLWSKKILIQHAPQHRLLLLCSCIHLSTQCTNRLIYAYSFGTRMSSVEALTNLQMHFAGLRFLWITLQKNLLQRQHSAQFIFICTIVHIFPAFHFYPDLNWFERQ